MWEDNRGALAQMTILIFGLSCLTRKNSDWKLKRSLPGLGRTSL